jgi:serralysin
MCTLCAQLQTFDTQCNLSGDVLQARVLEGPDVSGSINTSAQMAVGDSFFGYIGVLDDSDWVEVVLDAGKTYEFTLEGRTLSDSLMSLADGAGTYIDHDDDSYEGLDSQLTYTSVADGKYYVSATGFDARDFGSYTLTVVETAARAGLEVVSLDTLANYLTDGYWEDTNQTHGSFDTSSNNTLSVNLSGLTSDGKQLARWAFELWETVADINFVETRSSTADIKFTDHLPGAYATAAFLNTTIDSATVNVSTDWINDSGTTIDSNGLVTYVHEIGHALGLGHQGDYNGSGIFSNSATFANDSRQLSVMSYFDVDENPNVTASNTEAASAMMVDIIAIQNLYGAANNNSVSAGDSVWGANTNLTGYWAYWEDILAGNTISGVYDGGDISLTIYDQSGTDTLDLSTLSTNDVINLNGGTFSDVAGLRGNLGIARGTSIENLEAGSGDNRITGSGVANVINGYAGNDTISSGNGNDTIRGGNDNDRLWAGSGNDLVFGGADHDVIGGMDGLDTIWGGNGSDTIYGGGWSDTLGGAAGRDSILGENGNDLICGGDGNDTISGGSHDDLLRGGSHDDLIRGDAGNDNIIGGWGWDALYGGDGNDLVMGSNGNDRLYGGGGRDTLQGGVGDDTISGGWGNDTIFGGWGNDNLSGGAGADTFVFGFLPGNDVITDINASEGDILRINNVLWRDTHGVLSADEVVSTFGNVENGTLTLSFGMDETLVLNGVTNLDNVLEIFG